SDVARNPPSLIHGQHIGNVSIGFCLAPIDVSERLAVSVEHLVATGNLLNGPWCWETSHWERLQEGRERYGALASASKKAAICPKGSNLRYGRPPFVGGPNRFGLPIFISEERIGLYQQGVSNDHRDRVVA